MPSPTKADPRHYVQMHPPPSPSHRGIKIDARSSTIYTAATPSRNEVRKDNYNRRLDQMTSRGFRSVAYKPYKGVGDPFYLEERKLILHALGQWDESESDASYSSSEAESDSEGDVHTQTPKPITPAKFVLKRSRKGLNNLNKEVAHGRSMVRNVRLGHGLFHLIHQERLVKQHEVENILRERSEALKREWQPAKVEAGSDGETDDDLAEDVDLKNFMTNNDHEDYFIMDTPIPMLDSGPAGRVAFAGLADESKSRPSTVRSATSARSTRPGSKKKRVIQRPYTAQHTNISMEDPGQHKESIFHQLCALYWLLEAMNSDTPSTMAPICTSWNFKEIGGGKVSTKRLQKEKTTETSWNQFISQSSGTKATKRFTAGRMKRSFVKGLVPPSSARNSLTGSSSPNSSHSLINQAPGDGQKSPNFDTIREDEEAKSTPISEKGGQPSQEVVEEEDSGHNKSLFRFLDEYYASMRRASAGPGGGEDKTQTSTQDTTSAVQGEAGPQGGEKKRQKEKWADSVRKSARKPKKSVEGPTFSKSEPSAHMDERPASRGVRTSASGLVRPKSSPAMLEFQASLPSNKYRNLSHSLRLKFSEVGEEKALDLHDTLQQIEKQRLKVCQSKFMSLNNISNSFHRAVEDMRTKTLSEEKANEKLRRTSAHSPWFSDLVRNIPAEYRHEWHFQEIVEKLAKYGVVEGSKHSAYKLLKVLATLRQWEICSPDVSAAVEFCREKIVDMSVEEYEEWFQQQFPTVLRPQTAPSAVRTGQK